VLFDGPQPVFRTTRVEPATRHEEFGKGELVPPDGNDEQPLQEESEGVLPTPVNRCEDTPEPPHRESFEAALLSADSRSRPRSPLDADAAPESARTTTVLPSGTIPKRLCIWARKRRDTLCRITDPPTPFPTDKPTRVSGSVPATGGATCTTTKDRATRTPRRVVSGKSMDLRSLFPRGSMAVECA